MSFWRTLRRSGSNRPKGPVARITLREAGSARAKFIHDVGIEPAVSGLPHEMENREHDPVLLAFVDRLVGLSAHDWAGIVAVDEFANAFEPRYPTHEAWDELVMRRGQSEAELIAHRLNVLASCAASIALDYATTSAEMAAQVDRRLAKDWLNLTDELIGGGDRVVIAAVYGIVLRDVLDMQTLVKLHRPFEMTIARDSLVAAP